MDSRVRVTTSKPIRLDQLDAETGGHGLTSGDGVVVAVEGSPLTEGDLQTAIDAHDPEPRPPSAEERLATLEAEVRGMKERAAAKAEGEPTAREVAEAVRGDIG